MFPPLARGYLRFIQPGVVSDYSRGRKEGKIKTVWGKVSKPVGPAYGGPQTASEKHLQK